MKLTAFTALLHSLTISGVVQSFTHHGAKLPSISSIRQNTASTRIGMTIVSPFDNTEGESADDDVDGEGAATATATATGDYAMIESDEEPLELTWENVDAVLETMRPYLLQDGGNVAISEIDGPVVRLELQGECGTCPSSTQTMKMGLERKLRERIPEIQEVVQALPDTPDLNEEQINTVLDSVRPFLQVAGGSIDVDSITGEGSVQPTITLKMAGGAASLNSVKLEIAQRLQRHFMMSGLRIEWAADPNAHISSNM
mmetsp:Transcript_23385/g.50636  ORF Transcript_23385/g.50636 Transcript_23385/m.50636 type:complete len:257 (+) Transcript_23385:1458-2228(+)|eukprot:CAMPEP_0172305498 /NCGR_PEP_ID=MMETSP1058-20130122/6765_1 /TAXON_ID=83371 /ORGANISM="Detonula confervacea, Strain CCMP 353" /LENGTH=256 /DNA_ID=CAMNT_0013017117 /DNA_START=1420 /DNA_END=2190 /DNA_ORIENTATION=+